LGTGAPPIFSLRLQSDLCEPFVESNVEFFRATLEGCLSALNGVRLGQNDGKTRI
jgi:hypothetical protein